MQEMKKLLQNLQNHKIRFHKLLIPNYSLLGSIVKNEVLQQPPAGCLPASEDVLS